MVDYNTILYEDLTLEDQQDSDLKLSLQFDEVSGTIAYDSSQYGNDGTINGASRWVNQNNERALSFDGENDYIDCGSDQSLNLNLDFTIAAWIKLPEEPQDPALMAVCWGEDVSGKRRSLFIWNSGAGTNYYVYFSGYGTPSNLGGTTDISDNQWHHAVVTVSSNNIAKIYVDGIEENSGSITLSTFSFSGVYIGSSPLGDGFPEYFSGIIDDVRIYNRVLSITEIQSIFSATKSKYDPLEELFNFQDQEDTDWKTWLKFDEVSGTLVEDNTQYKHGGTLYEDPTRALNPNDERFLIFDGTLTYVEFFTEDLSNISFTILCWVKTSRDYGVSDGAEIVGKYWQMNQNIRMYIWNNGSGPQFGAYVRDSSAKAAQLNNQGFISDGEWHLVGMRWNVETKTLTTFLDGESTNSTTNSSVGDVDREDKAFWVGRRNKTTPDLPFDGFIDDVRIFGRSLSSSEIKAIYNATKNKYDPLFEPLNIEKPWLEGWKHRIKVTIPKEEVEEDLSNFPILIKLSSSSGINSFDVTSIFDEIGSNSKKIAVTEADGTTECYVEIEKWDKINEVAYLWVKVPSISTSEDTELHIYYDKSHPDNTFYVGLAPNLQPEEINPNVLYEDDETYWNSIEWSAGGTLGAPTLSEETSIVEKGNSALKIVPNTGSYSWVGFYHDYSPNEDWSSYNFLSFYWYGSNSGLTIYIQINAPDPSNKFTITFVDSFTGWKRILMPFKLFTETGSPDWSTVARLLFYWGPSYNPGTLYLDRTLIDVDDSSVGRNVWDDNFVMVQHMADTASLVKDSTNKDNDGKKYAPDEPTETTGQIGNAQDFDGTDDSVDCGNDTTLQGTTLTVSFWWYPTTTNTECLVTKKYNDNLDSYGWATYSLFGNRLYVRSHGTSQFYATFTKDGWIFCTAVINEENSSIFINSTKTSGSLDPIDNQYMGNLKMSITNPFNGKMEEVRVSNLARSDAWIKADYESQRDHFLSFQSEETRIPLSLEVDKSTEESFNLSDFLKTPYKILKRIESSTFSEILILEKLTKYLYSLETSNISTDFLSKKIIKRIFELRNFVDLLKKLTQKRLSESLNLAPEITKTFYKILREALSLTDRKYLPPIIRLIVKLLVRKATIYLKKKRATVRLRSNVK